MEVPGSDIVAITMARAFCDGHGIQRLREAGVVVGLVAPFEHRGFGGWFGGRLACSEEWAIRRGRDSTR